MTSGGVFPHPGGKEEAPVWIGVEGKQNKHTRMPSMHEALGSIPSTAYIGSSDSQLKSQY